jgi:leucyl-tRNA synthetase
MGFQAQGWFWLEPGLPACPSELCARIGHVAPGNFLSLEDTLAKYGADATRLTLADAGDTMDDANFEELTANAAVLRLTKELAWVREVLDTLGKLRGQETVIFADR